MKTRLHNLPGKQNGVVLLIALVLLVVVTVLSLSGMSTTTLEFLMASNQQARVNAFQQAQSGVDAVSTDLNNFPVVGLVGAERCTTGFDTSKYPDVSCGSFDIAVPSEFDLTYADAAVSRLPPLLQPAPRFIETSAEKLKVATFKIDSRYDARDIRLGRSEHNQGLIVTVLTPAEETTITDSDYD